MSIYAPESARRRPGHGVDFNPRRARKILRRWGYDVDAKGPVTDRLLDAWKTFRKHADSPVDNHKIARQWNGDNLRSRSTGKGGKPVVSGSASEMIAPGNQGVDLRGKRSPRADFVAATNRKVKTKTKARTHGKVVGGKGGGKVAGGRKGGGGGGGQRGGSLLPAGGVNQNKTLGTGMAETLAGAQFDPQIREAVLQQARQGRDAAQAERDIQSWGGQVAASQETARQRDVQAGATARGDVSNLVQALQSSLAGSQGAGVLAASGAADLTGIAQQAQAQDTFNADMAPILAAQRASDLSRQRALASQEADKLGGAIVDLRGQRGQAKQKALMDILQYNNQARQQNFGNQLALQNAALAAASLDLKGSELAANLKAMGLDYQLKKAGLAQANAQAKAAKQKGWGTLNAIDRRKLADQAVADAAAELPPGHWDQTHVLNSALRNLRAGGYLSARKRGYRGRIPNRQNQSSILGALANAIARQQRQFATPQ